MAKRLDVLVCETLGVSRKYAKKVILAGKCVVDGKIESKPGAKFDEGSEISVNADLPRFVSRGGEKLKKAIDVFRLDLRNLYCVDIGASTGGFTDCMLQNGAKAVLAVENGVKQLHPKLLVDERVISWENMDIREVSIEKLPFVAQFIATDLSFISIVHILPKIAELLAEHDRTVLLIKPQFEAGIGKVDKKGVLQNKKDHFTAILKVCTAAQEFGLTPLGLDFSPIKGQNGNREYLLLMAKNGKPSIITDKIIQNVVDTAFLEL